MRPSDLVKTRELVFNATPPGQTARAVALLAGLDGLRVSCPGANTVRVSYNLCEYTLESLETALIAQGFHLDGSVLSRIKRALAHYCEDVQRRNVAANPPDIKSQAFIQAYDHHLHGDRDDTPEAWRDYK
jgi:hypothetical protein